MQRGRLQFLTASSTAPGARDVNITLALDVLIVKGLSLDVTRPWGAWG